MVDSFDKTEPLEAVTLEYEIPQLVSVGDQIAFNDSRLTKPIEQAYLAGFSLTDGLFQPTISPSVVKQFAFLTRPPSPISHIPVGLAAKNNLQSSLSTKITLC